PGVEAGEDHHGGPGGAEPPDGALEHLGDLVRVGAGADYVVAARADGDQVRPELHRARQLVPDDLAEELAAHRQVGVAHLRDVRGEVLGEPVGPAAVAAVRRLPAVRIGIVHALGEAVAESDVGEDVLPSVDAAHGYR